jgi:tricorn protease
MVAGMLAELSLALLRSEPILRDPDVHGDRAVFACEGDIWLGDVRTGKAVRLTRDAGNEDRPRFSPDGTMIAFHGEYDGIRGAYVMPTSGGAPRRITPAMDFRSSTGWTADGRHVVYRKSGYPTNYEYWLAPLEKGAAKRLPLEFASHVWMGPTDDQFVFTRFNRWYAAWFHYIGGMQNQVWRYDGKSFRQITQTPGTNEFPVWVGKDCYFVNENEGRFTLMAVPVDGGKPKAVAPPSELEIYELSTDGKRVVYCRGLGIELYDPATGKARKLEFQLESDLIHTRPYRVQAQDHVVRGSLTPGAKRVLAETRGQIVSLPAGDGEARVWMAKPGTRLQRPAMSPDGSQVAYVSDEAGEQRVWLARADGSDPKPLTASRPRQITGLQWSPDGKWLAMSDSLNVLSLVDTATGAEKAVVDVPGSWFGVQSDFSPDSKWLVYSANIDNTDFGAIELYEVATGKKTRVSDGFAHDFAPVFSLDGKWLAFLSRRELGVRGDAVLNQLNTGATVVPCLLPLQASTPNPFAEKDTNEEEKKPEPPKDESAAKEAKPADPPQPELAGLYGRRVELPLVGNYGQIAVVGGRVLLAGDGGITFYDLEPKKGGRVTPGGGFQLNKDGSKMLIQTGSAFRVVDTKGADLPGDAGAVSWGALQLQIQPLEEWRQMFWDAWRLLRDYFYVANMHGLDWQSVGDKYAAMLPSVRSRSELDMLIRWMQGELGSSHQYLSSGDVQDIKPRVAAGFLGIDLALDKGALKITNIVKGDGFRTAERSPLADPSLGVTEGMCLLKVGGESVASETEVYDRLLGRAGQVVSLTVASNPGGEGAKTVYVRPMRDERRIRELAWVQKNRDYVAKASNGRIGYVYMRAMGGGDMSDFIRQYFPQRDKEALVIDVRFNNGGWVQSIINRILADKLTGWFNMRNSRTPWSRQGDVFLGPMACLINEFSISCGEEFPHRFKDLGRGPLIGRRTMGGEVGSSPGWPLADGGVVSVPNYGMFTRDGWVIEGEGVKPDIDVPSDPNAWVAGKDPQLDRAVKHLLDELARKPVQWPKIPPDRVRIK